MSLFSRIKRKVQKKLDAFSGEYSDAAPESTIPYHRPENNDESQNAEVVMARLNRPAAAGQSEKKSTQNTEAKAIQDDPANPEASSD